MATSEATKKNILVIYTGGTFGMQKGKKGLKPSPIKDVVERLKRSPNLNEEQKSEDFFTLTLPKMKAFGQVLRVVYTVGELPVERKYLDSSNMKPKDWKTIANEIKNQYTKYDGFVVIMGTDTMTYTASGLSFLMTNLEKSVVITGAQTSIFQNETDGVDNLLCALIAATTNISEVMICFNKNVYRGNRTVKIDCDEVSAFMSPNMNPLLTMIHIETTDVSRPSMNTPLPPLEIATFCDTDKVGILLLYPGIQTDKINSYLVDHKLDGVVLLTFGSGNAPGDVADILKEAADKKEVLILNVTQCLKGFVSSSVYATGQALGDNIISGRDITLEAAFAKLLYILGIPELTFEKRIEKLGQSLRGEMTNLNVNPSNNN